MKTETTNKEYTRNDIIRLLAAGEEGDWAWNDETGREAHIVNMCGGRYMLLMRGESWSARLTDDEGFAVEVMEGKNDGNE